MVRLNYTEDAWGIKGDHLARWGNFRSHFPWANLVWLWHLLVRSIITMLRSDAEQNLIPAGIITERRIAHILTLKCICWEEPKKDFRSFQTIMRTLFVLTLMGYGSMNYLQSGYKPTCLWLYVCWGTKTNIQIFLYQNLTNCSKFCYYLFIQCRWKVGLNAVVHKIFLELNSKTALQHSPKRLK